jgi:3-oxoacyl-[acyl-carrier protein] reductase
MRVLVTGGSSEISKAIVARRLEKGDEVLITASSEKSLESTLAHYADSSHGYSVKGFVFDLADPESQAEAVDRAVGNKGLDAIVLSAFAKQPALKPFVDFKYEEYRDYLRANIEGNAWLVHRFLPGMIERGFGRLVFVSSVSAATGTSRYPAYCTAKSAVEGLFLNLAVDCGEHGVLANIVRPGVIATKRNEKLWRRTGYDKRIAEIVPAGAIGKPEHVAQVVDLALERDSYVNGAILPVSGGLPLLRSGALFKS